MNEKNETERTNERTTERNGTNDGSNEKITEPTKRASHQHGQSRVLKHHFFRKIFVVQASLQTFGMVAFEVEDFMLVHRAVKVLRAASDSSSADV